MIPQTRKQAAKVNKVVNERHSLHYCDDDIISAIFMVGILVVLDHDAVFPFNGHWVVRWVDRLGGETD